MTFCQTLAAGRRRLAARIAPARGEVHGLELKLEVTVEAVDGGRT